MFNFGASSSTPAAPPAGGATSTPTFSFTGATPSVAPAAPFNFGGASTSTAPAAPPAPPQPSGGLFGQSQPQQQQQPAGTSGGLFGGGAGGGLFGAKPAAPTTGGGLFGGASTSTAPVPPAGGSLFGGAATQQQPQAGGLFGSTSAQTPAGGGLFGTSAQQSQQPAAQSGGLFGAQSTSTPAAGSLFGGASTAPKPAGGLFGQSTGLGTAPTQQPSLGQSTNTQAGGMNKHTKFSELPEGHQKIIEQMDGWIKQQKEPAGKINTEPLGKVIWKTSGEVKAASEEYAALAQGLSSLQTSLVALRDKFVAEEEDLRRIAEIWETFKAADGRPGAVRTTHREFPQDFFSRMAASMEERVQRYKKTLIQLNRAVNALSSDQEAPSPQAIAQTINNHQNALLNLAAQLERQQLRMNDLRGAFARDYQLRTNSMRDPFEIAREEKGMPPVSA